MKRPSSKFNFIDGFTRSMYAERSCRCTSHHYCVALEAREGQFVTAPVDPVFTLVREGCLLNRNFGRAPEIETSPGIPRQRDSVMTRAFRPRIRIFEFASRRQKSNSHAHGGGAGNARKTEPTTEEESHER